MRSPWPTEAMRPVVRWHRVALALACALAGGAVPTHAQVRTTSESIQFLRGDSEIKRAISVLKTRGSAHDPQIRQFEITADGFCLGQHFQPEQSLL